MTVLNRVFNNIVNLPSRFKTLAGTRTEGGCERALACCEGGITEQYSLGLLGLGLPLLDSSAKK